MNVLLDHCVPKRFGGLLPGHGVRTAYEMGWSGLKNGQLLTQAAAGGFDIVVTVDQNLRFQQNLAALPLTVVILIAPNNRFETIEPCAAHVLAALPRLAKCSLVTIDTAGVVTVVTTPPTP